MRLEEDVHARSREEPGVGEGGRIGGKEEGRENACRYTYYYLARLESTSVRHGRIQPSLS